MMTEKQRLILSVSVIVLCTASLGTLWGFGFKEERALDKQAGAARADLEKANKVLAGLEELQRGQRESAAKAKKLADLLPDRPDPEQVYDILEEAERQAGQAGSGVDFTLLGGKLVEPKKKVGSPSTLPWEGIDLELTALGTWAGFVSFLDAVEHADRLIQVKSFKTAGPDKVNPSAYEYRIVLTIFSLKPPQAPPAAKPAAPGAKP